MFLYLLVRILIFSPAFAYAVPSGLEHEFERFIEQIDMSTPFLTNALSRFQTNYTTSLSGITTSEYLSTDNDIASSSSPISKIIYGYVSYSDASSNYTNFRCAGADNAGMYVLEVQFKTSADKPDISPLIAGKCLVFVAYGTGDSNPIIYRNTDNGYLGGGASDNSAMTSIAGYSCINKTSRCIDTAGSHPSKTCNGSLEAITGQSTRAGFYDSPTGSSVNIFYYVTGDFSLCATTQSARNCMAASNC